MSEKNMEEKVERTWSETIEVAGSRLADKVKELVKEGNVRRLIIRKPDNEVLMEIPLTAGVGVGGVMAIFAPVLTILGAIAALVFRFRLEVVRSLDANATETAVEEVEAEAEKELA